MTKSASQIVITLVRYTVLYLANRFKIDLVIVQSKFISKHEIFNHVDPFYEVHNKISTHT